MFPIVLSADEHGDVFQKNLEFCGSPLSVPIISLLITYVSPIGGTSKKDIGRCMITLSIPNIFQPSNQQVKFCYDPIHIFDTLTRTFINKDKIQYWQQLM